MLDSISACSYPNRLHFTLPAGPPGRGPKRPAIHRPGRGIIAVLVGALGCRNATEPSPVAEAVPVAGDTAALTTGFAWTRATPESQGMCGSIRQLGCTKTLQQV